MKKFVISTLAASLALSAAAVSTTTMNKTPNIKQFIHKLTHGQASVTKQFKAIAGMTGYVVEPKGTGRSMIVYTTPKKNYLFIGNIISTKTGANIGGQYNAKYINAGIAKKVKNSVANTTYFTAGKNSAPHKMYVFFDPNCSACNMFYTEIDPLIQSGKVQVRFVPVAFLKQSSRGKAVTILMGKTDQDRAKLLHQDEAHFNMQEESGALTAAKEIKANKKYFDQVIKNTEYFTKQGFYATPTIIYQQTNGQPGYKTGAMPAAMLKKFLATVSNKW